MLAPLALLCLGMPAMVAADSYTVFTDSFAREKIVPLAAATYAANPQQCLDSQLPGAQLVHKYDVNCDYFKDKCVGIVAISPADQAIIIAYRGTQGAMQLIAEIQENAFDKHVPFVAGGKVSLYFNTAFEDLWKGGIGDAFLKVAKENPAYQLWVTGHSLGGSLGSLTAGFIAANGLFPSEQIRLITFGQPRTGDKQFADHHDQLVPHSFRITHNKDLVPHIPTEWMGYHHHSTEIFYPNNMAASNVAYKTCGKQEDAKCSDGHLDFSIKDHLHYFDRDLSDWGAAGCQ